jgi:outer membrane protein
MKNKLIAAALFVLGLGYTAVNAQTQKIGYVDSGSISEKLPEVKQATAQLTEFQKVKEAEFRKEAELFQQQVADYTKNAEGMEAGMRAAKERELQAKEEQLQLKQTNIQADLQKRQQQVFDPIEKRIQEAITQVANENGYAYILRKEALLHFSAADDISELVTKKLLASAPKTDATTQKPAGAANNQTGSNTPTNTTAPKKKQ